MENKELNLRHEFMLEKIVEAGQMALDFFAKRKTLKIDKKGVQDFVSIADKNVEVFLTQQIVKNFPKDEVFGEESQKLPTKEDGIWVIDPIDGTLPFLTGMPNWCISVAYIQQNKPVLGVVFDPNLNEIFHAQKGKKSFLNDKPIEVNLDVDLEFGMVGYGFSPRSKQADVSKFLLKLLNNKINVYKSGSGALMLCYTAASRLNAYFEAVINPWDVAAGIIICQEAGLKCSQFASGSWLKKAKHILAAPPKIYDHVANLINEESESKFDFSN